MAKKKRSNPPAPKGPNPPPPSGPSSLSSDSEGRVQYRDSLTGEYILGPESVRPIVRIVLELREPPFSEVPSQHWSREDWERLEKVARGE